MTVLTAVVVEVITDSIAFELASCAIATRVTGTFGRRAAVALLAFLLDAVTAHIQVERLGDLGRWRLETGSRGGSNVAADGANAAGREDSRGRLLGRIHYIVIASIALGSREGTACGSLDAGGRDTSTGGAVVVGSKAMAHLVRDHHPCVR